MTAAKWSRGIEMTEANSCETPDKGLLDGLRVVEFGDRLAGRIVGMLLAEQGAEVIRVLDQSRPAPPDPVLQALLARGKTEISLDPGQEDGRTALTRMLAKADVAIEDLPAGTVKAMGIDFEAIRNKDNPGLISCSMPAFTEDDPRTQTPDYEAMVNAAGYLFEKPLGPPLYHGFPIGSVIGALFGAISVVSALIARLKTGKGQQADVTRFHSNLFAQMLLVLMKAGIPRGFLPLKMIGTPFMGCWKCGDGRWIYLHITLPAHNAQILDVLEGEGYTEDMKKLRAVLSPETMRDPSQVKSISEAKKIRRIYERVFLTKSADEWEDLLGGDLCCIKARTVDEWLRDSMEAGMSDASAVDDPVFGELLGPGPAVTSPEHPPTIRPRIRDDSGVDAVLSRWETGPRPEIGQSKGDKDEVLKHPLQGVKLLDLSRIIAGPCAARVLAELGAEVLSVQSPTGLDWALSFHLMFNPGKKSVTLDFTDDAGKEKLWAIINDFNPDAMIQNYRHLDVARAAGVDPEAVRKRFPDIVYTHLNAYGNEGVWRDRPGFEQVVQAVSGIQMSYGKDGKPRLLPTPVIDIGSGLTGAFAALLGLYHHAMTGHGTFTTTHLTRTAVLLQVPWVSAFQRERCLKAADARGMDPGYDPGRQVIGGLVKVKGGHACLAGPHADIEAWARHLGIAQTNGDLIAAVARRMRRKTAAHWQQQLSDAGLGDTVAVFPVPRLTRIMEELPDLDPMPEPMAFKREYPDCPSEMAFVRNPIRLSETPLVDIEPCPARGGNTREVMARIGVDVPEGTGVIPYPENKPLLIWLGSVIRWGYFAWRSGNI